MHCTRGETNKSQSIAFSVNSHLHLSLDGKWSEEIYPDPYRMAAKAAVAPGAD